MKRLTSVFTDNMDICIETGRYGVERHHIFGASNRNNSEKRGFVIPLIPKFHNISPTGIHFNRALDLKYKHMAQDYYLEHYGSKEQFIAEFGKWW